MKLFLRRLLFFLFPFFILFLLVELKLRTIESIRYVQKKKGLIEFKDSIEILVLGNSHTEDGINPECFSKFTYNLANSAQTISLDKQLIYKYIHVLPKLKYILLNIDYHVFHQNKKEGRDFFYAHYFNLNESNQTYVKENLSFFFFVYSPPIAINLLLHPSNKKLNKGWIGIENSDGNNELTVKKGKERANLLTKQIQKSILKGNQTNYILLDTLIHFLKTNQITPILITTPCHPFYINQLNNALLKTTSQQIAELSLKHKTIYVNMLEDKRFDSSDFYNVDHLNSRGATKYSFFLNDTLNNLIWNKKSAPKLKRYYN